MRWVRRWIAVALIAAVLIGGWSLKAGNDVTVTVDFLFGRITLELWEALLCAFAAGLALTGAGWLWAGLRSRMLERRYRKAVEALEAEVHQLRTLPLETASGRSEARGGEPVRASRWGG